MTTSIGTPVYTVKYIHQTDPHTEVTFTNQKEAKDFHERILEDPFCYGSTLTATIVLARRMKQTYETMAAYLDG